MLTVLRRVPADREVSISVRVLLLLQVNVEVGGRPSDTGCSVQQQQDL